MKMKAAVYYGPGDIRVEEIERPGASEEGMVIKVGACGICPIMDIPRYRRKLLDHASEIVLGHEFCGDVIEVGTKVSHTKIGDKIYGLAFQPCGKCDACINNDYIKCENFEQGTAGTWINGGFAEYMRFPFATSENVTILPEGMSHRDGALIEPVSVGVGLASKAKEGDIVIIMGQELIGLATLAQIKRKGGIRVIVTDLSEKRLEKSKEIGADVIVNENREDPVSIIMRETSGRGADVVIETAGREATFLKSIDAVRPHGDIWLGAFYEGPFMFDPSLQRPEMPHSNLTQKGGISMHCAWLTLPNRSLRRSQAIELIESGIISAAKHVTHFYPLDEIQEAFKAAINPLDSIKVVVEP